MGDWALVILEFPAEFKEEANAIIAAAYEEGENITHDEAADIIRLSFEEVNYGELPFLSEMADAGIPYNSSWSSGSNYGAGTEYNRYTSEGCTVFLNIFDEDINPSIAALMTVIDEPIKLQEMVRNHHRDTTPLPWDNQVEYAKKYRVLKLINPAHR